MAFLGSFLFSHYVATSVNSIFDIKKSFNRNYFRELQIYSKIGSVKLPDQACRLVMIIRVNFMWGPG